jgi:hypothetical protein
MSNPAATANTSGSGSTPSGTGTAPSTAPSGTGTTPSTGGSGTVPTTGGSTAPDFVIYEKNFTSDLNWPADLVLKRAKSNWFEWDRRIHFIANQCGFGAYLRGTFPKPNTTLHL